MIALPAAADETIAGPPTIAEATEGLARIDGFIPLYWDEVGGRLLAELARFDEEILYQVSLSSGVGSNPIGLDRGQLGESRVVVFRRIGPKVLMIERNTRFRALTGREAERRAVEDSFASSVLAGFEVEAAEGDRVLVEFSPFALRDAHGIAATLRRSDQGSYWLDVARSAIDLPRTRGFPKNTEIEALLTFATEGDPGRLLRETTPSPEAVSLRQRLSFIELPPIDGEGSYSPRRLDPRVGVFGIEFYDYAKPIDEPIETRWIARHRLEKADPAADRSEPVEPIVYYVDPGAPEPIRSALVEGASWWNEAFEAAGFINAFRVEVLPEDADPMDVRYNVINWVHRSTRGWSYGSSVIDPRTGEILKGHVTLGSLRVRQDYLIGTGLVPVLGADASAMGCECALMPSTEYLDDLDPAVDAEAMALARLRQLSAHEVGHTIGLAHNFAASTYGRESVMDYPAPLVRLTQSGGIDLSDAYAEGIGAYDTFAIRYAYTPFPPEADEEEELDRIIREGVAAGMLFLSDADARPAGAAHPLANLWDNGDDPVAMLRHELEVRRIGLERFGPANIDNGSPMAMLEAKLLPLYLHHRFQLQAAVKSVGGASYTYAVKDGDGTVPEPVVAIVPARRQREALDAVLATIDPETLVLPDRLLALIPPRPFGYQGGTAESFSGHTGPTFDPVAAASIAADLAVSGLLRRERAARLIDYHSRDESYPDFNEVVGALVDRAWRDGAPASGSVGAIRRAVQSLVVTRLMELADDDEAAPEVRATATEALRGILDRVDPDDGPDPAPRRAIRDDITRFLERPAPVRSRAEPPPAPPGDPIGSGRG
ncbi:DUF5117 domain-containing protein [Tautonia sociabilis]|uniref:DUF5117 domain-containing protein n=2 Tax=Tautonia sociabilis TaxID=2080755 RepID=A0A432MHU7_9BACT|nr:DUF5117 domain-containing protein [Tautonia sociabilis]